jgi:hypothetical protein
MMIIIVMLDASVVCIHGTSSSLCTVTSRDGKLNAVDNCPYVSNVGQVRKGKLYQAVH